MTLEELNNKSAEIDAQEVLLNAQLKQLSDAIHDKHVEKRALYKEYVDEHFPYKVGDKLKYTFMNRDGDTISRNITITEIDTYLCSLDNIIIEYEYGDMHIGQLYYVTIKGHCRCHECLSLEKIEK